MAGKCGRAAFVLFIRALRPVILNAVKDTGRQIITGVIYI